MAAGCSRSSHIGIWSNVFFAGMRMMFFYRKNKTVFKTIIRYTFSNLKTIRMKKNIFLSSLLAVFSTVLFSFSASRGGDSFSIYLNEKLILQQFIYADKSVKTISLSEARPGDELRVQYSHCGVVGKNRVLTIKDSQNNVVKQLRFANGKNSMVFKLRDISGGTAGKSRMQLIYSSAEIPGGFVLASLIMDKSITLSIP